MGKTIAAEKLTNSELVSYMHFVKEEKSSDIFAGNIFVITGRIQIQITAQ